MIPSTATYQFRIESSLKEQFLQTVKQQGDKGSHIIRKFLQIYVQKPQIFSLDFDCWIDELVKKPSIKKEFSNLNNALACHNL